jgi:PncC family amidohydrolase
MDCEILLDSTINSNIKKLSNELGNLLKKNGLTISVAESCTGGLVSHLITAIPGSSEYFQGSIIAYSNRIKSDLLGIQKGVLKKYGAVSREVAKGMAKGVRELMKSDVGISTTGIAGPTGGSKKKPVGMVVFGIDIKGKITTNIKYFVSPRNRIKMEATTTILKILKNSLERL